MMVEQLNWGVISVVVTLQFRWRANYKPLVIHSSSLFLFLFLLRRRRHRNILFSSSLVSFCSFSFFFFFFDYREMFLEQSGISSAAIFSLSLFRHRLSRSCSYIESNQCGKLQAYRIVVVWNKHRFTLLDFLSSFFSVNLRQLLLTLEQWLTDVKQLVLI